MKDTNLSEAWLRETGVEEGWDSLIENRDDIEDGMC